MTLPSQTGNSNKSQSVDRQSDDAIINIKLCTGISVASPCALPLQIIVFLRSRLTAKLRNSKCKNKTFIKYIFMTVHLRIILVGNELDAKFLL